EGRPAEVAIELGDGPFQEMRRLYVVQAEEHQLDASRGGKPALSLLCDQRRRGHEPFVVEIAFVLQIRDAIDHGPAGEERRDAEFIDLKDERTLRRRLLRWGADVEDKRSLFGIRLLQIHAAGRRRCDRETCRY